MSVTTAGSATSVDESNHDVRRFWWWLAGITVAALVIRLVVLALSSRVLPYGDSIWYDLQSHFIADGHGYIGPGHFLIESRRLATA